MKIPEGFDITGINSAMMILENDPNFTILKRVVEENDIARLSQQLEEGTDDMGKELDEKTTSGIRYRLRVLKEVFQMPKKIQEEITKASQPAAEEKRDDPYDTEEDLKKK